LQITVSNIDKNTLCQGVATTKSQLQDMQQSNKTMAITGHDLVLPH